MRSKALDKAMYELEKARNMGNSSFRQFSESLHNDDIDQAYVLLDELISSFAKIAGMRCNFIAALYDEERIKYVRADLDRLINEEAEK